VQTLKKEINPLLIGLLICVPPLVCFAFNLNHAAVTAIFITIIGLWLTEALPLAVTGLLVPVLAVFYGAMSVGDAFQSFGSDILFLFLGCFLMGRAMEVHGFDKRLAYFLLGRCLPSTSFLSVNIILALATFFLSMWISNTSATAILCAVTIGVLSCLDDRFESDKIRHRASVRLLLSCAFAASIGGLATPVGSPPNLIALKFLAQQGINISFFEWLALGLPITLVMLFLMLCVFEFLYPLRDLVLTGIKEHFCSLLKELGPMKAGEKQIAVIFLLTITLWILPSILACIWPEAPTVKLLNDRLPMSVVGLVGGLLPFLLPVREKGLLKANLNWKESERVDWGTLMLFGGGLTLGILLEQSGAAKDVGNFFFSENMASPVIIAILVVVLSIVMSEFASNTAAASILIPLIIGTAVAHNFSEESTKSIVLAATFGASFGFMLPVSTPPNAIVYGTGKVPASEMRKAGIIFDVIGAVLIILFLFLLR